MHQVTQRIIDLLDSNDIPYQLFIHKPIVTSQEASQMRGTDIAQGAKSLIFLADNTPLLLVLGGDKRVDFKAIKSRLSVKDLKMASHDEVKRLTGCDVGGVPPIGLVLDIATYLDDCFMQNDMMDYNAGDRGVSIKMAVSDYLKLQAPTLLPFSQS